MFALLAALAGSALGHAAEAAPDKADAANTDVSELVVTAQKLDAARATIEPALGASSFTISSKFVDNLPGGQNTGLNQVILQAPGVTQDSFGQLHIRGDHANIQYRLNNVILPEGLSVFGQTLSPRLAGSTELITGALPAQYGLRTAGIVNITTKSGLYHNGGDVSVYGGSHGEFEPSFDYGGSSGANNFFVSGSYTRSDLGIESPDGSGAPLHDRTDQIQLFGYLDHIIDDTSRISLIAGTSNQRFQIPDVRGLNADDPGGLGLTVNGQTSFASEALRQSQRETTDYAIASYLRTTDRLTLQLSGFTRYSTLTYRPDPLGELLFNGISQYAAKRDFAAGLQTEAVYKLNDAHTIRGGVIIEGDRSISRTTAQVLPTDAFGVQTSDVPETIVDNGARTAWTYSAFLQDEWKLADSLTLNYGLRFDEVDALRNERQLSPRVNLVWKPTDATTVHAGYARYFTPPSFELIAAPTVAKFVGTTAQSPNLTDTTPYSERDNYYDVGVQQRFGELTVGIDGYLRYAKNLIDEGQFGAPIILTPFNYRDGRIRGIEVSATYSHGPFSAYGNLALSKAQGRDIVSSQFNFYPADLAYIQSHYIYLDHNQSITASGGASYSIGALKLSGDLIIGSGLRKDGAVPNGDHVPAYAQLNLSATYHLAMNGVGPLDLRFDIINVNDDKYEIRDGTGVGVGAPQWGPRRGFFGGISKSF
ncbi:TonB-dependent receptor [Caulobacter sp. KR2-114]|uniref:TonB-dependent receptor n=1 Tax=Caulobacter sp. KR2-114 TaxID=3400912 RepID=UPI003C077548